MLTKCQNCNCSFFVVISVIICVMLVVDFSDNWQELVEKIKLEGMRPGVALKPGTPIEEVYPLVVYALSSGNCFFSAGKI